MGYTPAGYADGGSYTFHFPDGNATIARLLVRNLIPGGRSRPGLPRRRHREGRLRPARPAGQRRAHPPLQHRRARPQPRRSGRLARSRDRLCARGQGVHGARRATACWRRWNMMIPYLCPELPGGAEGGAALAGEDAAGLHQRGAAQLDRLPQAGHAPGSRRRAAITPTFGAEPGRWTSAAMTAERSPDKPILLHMVRTPCQPGLPEHEQNKAGRAELLATPFETFERNIRDQLGRIAGRRRLRSGARHHRHHRQSLAARLRAGIQSAVGARPAAGAAAERHRPRPLRPHRHRQFGFRPRRLHRLGDQPGPPGGGRTAGAAADSCPVQQRVGGRLTTPTARAPVTGLHASQSM